jgi:hypothetical protein
LSCDSSQCHKPPPRAPHSQGLNVLKGSTLSRATHSVSRATLISQGLLISLKGYISQGLLTLSRVTLLQRLYTLSKATYTPRATQTLSRATQSLKGYTLSRAALSRATFSQRVHSLKGYTTHSQELGALYPQCSPQCFLNASLTELSSQRNCRPGCRTQ